MHNSRHKIGKRFGIPSLLIALMIGVIVGLLGGFVVAPRYYLQQDMAAFFEANDKALEEAMGIIEDAYGKGQPEATPAEKEVLVQLKRFKSGEIKRVADDMLAFSYLYAEKGQVPPGAPPEAIALPASQSVDKVLQPHLLALMLYEECTHAADRVAGKSEQGLEGHIEEEIRAAKVWILFYERLKKQGVKLAPKLPKEQEIIEQYEESYELYQTDMKAFEENVRKGAELNYKLRPPMEPLPPAGSSALG